MSISTITLLILSSASSFFHYQEAQKLCTLKSQNDTPKDFFVLIKIVTVSLLFITLCVRGGVCVCVCVGKAL